MKNQQIRYIQKYIDMERDKINENSNIIENLLFYKKDIDLQKNAENDLLFRSSGSMLGLNKKQVKQPIYELLNYNPANNFEFPDNKKFGVCLTHDIDDIYPPTLHTVFSSLYCIKNLNFDELKKQLFWKSKGKKYSPYCNFKKIMKLEEKYDGKSSFYFVATDKDIHRFRYDSEELIGASYMIFIVPLGS